MLTVVTAVGAVLVRLIDSSWEPAIPPSAVVAVLGGLSTLLVLFRIVVPPDFGDLGGVPLNAIPKLGVFLGLAAAAAVAYGGYRAMGERGTSFERIADALSRGSQQVGRRTQGGRRSARTQVRKQEGRPRTTPYAAAICREMCLAKAMIVIIGLTPTEVGKSEASAT